MQTAFKKNTCSWFLLAIPTLRTGAHGEGATGPGWPKAYHKPEKPPAAGTGGQPSAQPPGCGKGRAGPAPRSLASLRAFPAPFPHLWEAPAGAEAVDLHLVEAGDLHGRCPAHLFRDEREAEAGGLPARSRFRPAAAAVRRRLWEGGSVPLAPVGKEQILLAEKDAAGRTES